MTRLRSPGPTSYILLSAILQITIMTGAPEGGDRKFHQSKEKKDCLQCHKGNGDALKPEMAGICVSCHKTQKEKDHRIGIPAGEKRAKNLPLEDGKVTCHTCHDPHGSRFRAYLRTRPEDLCSSCHIKE